MTACIDASVVVLLCSCASAPVARPPSRGRPTAATPQRTGCTDGKAGPGHARRCCGCSRRRSTSSPSPVPRRRPAVRLRPGRLQHRRRSTASTPTRRPRSASPGRRRTPCLKLPTVSSPAVADGKLIFGDGMHQTNGAVLYCLEPDKGTPLWQLPVPGTLVHLEGSPTVADGKVYLGGGAAGVLCVDPSNASRSTARR